jgi:cyclic beta-1,2-glucan synthetase
MYRAGLECMLGFTKRGERLYVAPCINPAWPGFRIRYRYGATVYEISVENPRSVAHGVLRIDVDGVPLAAPDEGIVLSDDGVTHLVVIVMG